MLNLSCRFIIRKVTDSFNMCMYILYAYIVIAAVPVDDI